MTAFIAAITACIAFVVGCAIIAIGIESGFKHLAQSYKEVQTKWQRMKAQ